MIPPQAPANRRDLGGAALVGGGVLAAGRLLRAALGDRPDIGAIGSALGPSRTLHVFDLRRDAEIDGPPAVAADGGRPAVCHHRVAVHDPEWHRVPTSPDRPDVRTPDYFVASARRTLPAVATLAGAALDRLDRGDAVLVGCRLGKDRSGLLVLVLGRALGVADDDLVDDHVRTGAAYRAAPAWVAAYAAARGEPPARVLRRLCPVPEIPRGILRDLPTDVLGLAALTGVGVDTLTRVRGAVVDDDARALPRVG